MFWIALAESFISVLDSAGREFHQCFGSGSRPPDSRYGRPPGSYNPGDTKAELKPVPEVETELSGLED